ncbi:hypothetical protein F4556_000050 [Kitasatospora gansuensis]|uniref:Uncharacterized protein n=1 Tax=Kitasatospora gansuensis TaxID=258050 RepID=A0A7W7S600_9ACTN|nr:hypothetical protein [Kitasatospora gansuensis]MBB4944515.1 hypothetical protein [Kitasatospora gansuensis]
MQDRFWYEGSNWQGFELAPAGSAAITSGVAAVSRIPTSMEVWYVGLNGSVQDRFWYEGNNWQSFELAPPGSASTHTGIGAVSRIPGSMEVWFVGANGSVQDRFWYEGSNWQGFELAPAGSASITSGVAAVSRIPGSMELWFVGGDASLQDHFWYDTSSKNFDQDVTTDIAIGGSAHVVMRQDGFFSFSTHAHDSGFDNIDYTISAAVMTPDGTVFTFQHSGHTEGTVAGLPFGTPDRNDDFTFVGNNPQITEKWDGILNGTFKASLEGTDTLAAGVTGALGDLVNAIVSAAGKAAAEAVIKLVF